MKLSRMGHVVGDEVVEPADYSGEFVLGCSSWEAHEALGGGDILLPLGNAHVAPDTRSGQSMSKVRCLGCHSPFPSNGCVLESTAIIGSLGDLLVHVCLHLGNGVIGILLDNINRVDRVAVAEN